MARTFTQNGYVGNIEPENQNSDPDAKNSWIYAIIGLGGAVVLCGGTSLAIFLANNPQLYNTIQNIGR